MKYDNKKIILDLDFLDGNAPEKTEGKKPESKDPESVSMDPVKDTSKSASMKWMFGAVGVSVLVIIIIVAAAQQASNSSGGNSTPEVAPNITPGVFPLPDEKTAPIKVTTPAPKTPNQICKDTYGSHSYSTGKKNIDGGPVCGCNDGYTWNDSQTICIAVPAEKTGAEICKDRNGLHATYDSASNSCGCASGYDLGAISKQCVSFTTARDENCAASYPGTSFLKYDQTSGKNICDCRAGYDWNDDRTACYTTVSFNQLCVNSYGTGAYSTTENGRRVCDCLYGYSWNIERNTCITTASINQMCEINQGRNSRYSGRIENGKYICTEPN